MGDSEYSLRLVKTRSPSIRFAPLLACWLASSSPAPAQLVINEVYYDTTGPAASKQFIELFNSGNTTTFLDGLVLGDEAGSGIEGLYQFPGAGTDHPVPPGGLVVIAADADGSDTNPPDLSALAQWECYSGAGDYDNPAVSNLSRVSGLLDLSLFGGGDNVLLASGSDTSAPLDQATLLDGMNINGGSGEVAPLSTLYDDENPAALSGSGFSLSRCPNGNDSDVASALDFIPALPSPGSANPSGCPPFVVVRDQAQLEAAGGPASAVFTLVTSYASTQDVVVSYVTSNGTALGGSDFNAATGFVTFAPGVRTQTVAITIVADGVVEPNETFALFLQAVSNATVARALPTVTLLNDDSPGMIISDASVLEGQSGSTNLKFIVSLPSPATNTVTVQAQTSNGTAVAGSDYTALATNLVFPPGAQARTVTVVVASDEFVEPNETLFVNLANATNAVLADNQGLGTILNDDTAAALSLQKTVYLGHNGGASCPGSESVSGTNGTAVTYCFRVQNTGGATLTNVLVTDALLGVGPLAGGTLATGQTVTLHVETLISGSLTNTGQATAQPSTGGTLTNTDTAAVIAIAPPNPVLALAKTVYLGHNSGASCPGLEFVLTTNGAPLTYCFSVANVGNVALTNVAVFDPALGLGPLAVGLLASGQTANVFAEVLAGGSLTNFGYALGYPVTGGDAVSNQDSAIANVQSVAPGCVGTYSLFDLGTLGGTQTEAYAINDRVQVVGFSRDTGGVKHAFVWTGGAMSRLLTNQPAVTSSVAHDINVRGEVVGQVSLTNSLPRGFAYSNGVLKLQHPIEPATNNFSETFAINNGGQMAGYITTNIPVWGAFPQHHPCYVTNDTVVHVGTYENASTGVAYDLNTNGVVVGFAARYSAQLHWRPFLWADTNANATRDGDEFIDLGTFDGGNGHGYAYSINALGQVVGFSTLAGGERAFLITPVGGQWNPIYLAHTTNPLMINLPSLGGVLSEAHAINDGGDIVGFSQTGGGQRRAVLWRDGAITDLNGLICTNSGWVLSEARDINNSGQVVGFGSVSGQTHGFLLSLSTGTLEIVRTELQLGGGAQVALYWRAAGAALGYTLESSDRLQAPNWSTVTPTNQWPQLLPFWVGDPGMPTNRVLRVRAATQP